jgi:CRP/FNR family transcriptional regulator, cyclic AMP receptor protein
MAGRSSGQRLRSGGDAGKAPITFCPTNRKIWQLFGNPGIPQLFMIEVVAVKQSFSQHFGRASFHFQNQLIAPTNDRPMTSDDKSGFKIWAVDNIVYGPVELPTLVGWVKEDRVTRDTWIYSEVADAWNKAAHVPELQMFFRSHGGTGAGPASETTFIRALGLRPGALRRIKIFAGMDDSQLERFVNYMEISKTRQFAEIVKTGDPGDGMYLVLEGEVRVRMIIGTKETILAVLGPGEFFGEIALFDHGPRSADVVANQDATLLKVSAGDFQRLANEAPELATPFLLAMGKTLTQRIRADNKRYRETINVTRLGTAGK